MKDLTEGSPIKRIMEFAIPVCLGNVFQLFYSLADTRIVGSFLGGKALASVGATSSLNNMIIGFLLGLTNGFSIVVARHFGAKDEKGMRKAVGGTVKLGFLFAFFMTIVSVLFLKQILLLLSTPKELLAGSEAYFRIILLGMTASMFYNVCSGLMRAIGDSLTPLVFLMISTVVNVGLDLLFVCTFQMGVEGAALATVIAQTLSFVACFTYLWKRYEILHFSMEDLHISKKLTKQLLSTGCSMGFMSSLINIGSVALQGAINSLNSSNIIVAHTAARKITEIFMLPFSVFGVTMSNYCGQNKGANKPKRIVQGMRQVIIITWIWCAFMILLSYTIVPELVRLVTGTTEREVIATASLYLRIDTILYFIPGYICIVRNAMQGVGDTVTPVVSSSLELVCKVAVAVLLAPKLGYMAIILSEPIAWVIMVVPLIVGVRRNPMLSASA